MHFERDEQNGSSERTCKRYNVMKKTYHLCISADDEVIFRDQEDLNRGFNCFALSLYKTGSTGLVEAFMTTHCHLMAETEDPEGLIYNMRMPYSKYFNHKYNKHGRVGEQHHFQIEVVGFYHKQAAAIYTLRNPVHHGISPIPYAYPHSTANHIFRSAMGKPENEDLLPRKSFYRYIGKRAEYPDTYKMDKSGLFVRSSVLDITQVENLFVTPRAFDYHMCRKTSEEWIKEQNNDNNGQPPITIGDIESGVKMHDIEEMLAFEHGRSDYRRPSDLDLCRIIDKEIVPQYGKPSIYHLTQREKMEVAELLYRRFHAGKEQIIRCLIMEG